VWQRLWVVPLVSAAVGVVALAGSLHPSLGVMVWDPDHDRLIRQPEPTLMAGGWFAFLFGILYQPRLSLTGDGRWS
jgi:hypothetical protein